ncbi:MAG: penicillin acylase family protein, partial [Ferruginibacter sp.]
MRFLFILPLVFFSLGCSSPADAPADSPEIKRLKLLASQVTITRDTWGIPHIYGRTDAEAVFGLMYAQCEESFERVEKNYLQLLGRMSETESDAYIYQDLEMKILYDSSGAIADYHKAPDWLKKLLHGFADGINYYLHMHPDVKPKALTHFEPWYPLMFTDGAYISTNTGGLEREDLKQLYGDNNWLSKLGNVFIKKDKEQPTGSNAFAIGPARSATGNTLLYINPHVSFYFRTEVHMVSDEGLNAYGAATWGQFFIFQGFNEHCGWMHTSSAADAADLYAEKIIKKDGHFFYEYDGAVKPVSQKKIIIAHKTNGNLNLDSINIFYTHHGPVMGSRNGQWLSVKERNRSAEGLVQSWQRMKAVDLTGFKNALALKGNTSTNTMYADDKGNIAYWHGNFIPRRDPSFKWNKPVDGSLASTEWKSTHDLTEIVSLENPVQGFLQNCNSSPFSVAGFNTLDKTKYPAYMAPEGENFRSIRALDLIEKEKSFTIDKLAAVGYDHYLGIFDSLLPALFNAYDALPVTLPLSLQLREPVSLLRSWDKKSGVESVATTLAIFWANQLLSENNIPTTDESIANQLSLTSAVAKHTTALHKLEVLQSLVAGLERAFGSWKIPWGQINRFQRTTGSMYPAFNDRATSLPVGMVSAYYGSLPAFEAVWQKTEKQYGVAGNSFIAVVEFGKRLSARSIVAGGQSFDPSSKHFNDQAEMFINGKLKDVFFYKEDVEKNKESSYHPG